MKVLFRSANLVLVLFALLVTVGCGDEFASVEDQPAVAKAAFEILPSNTEMVGSVNFDNSLVNDHMDQFPLEGAGEAKAQIENFLSATGFDPAEDLDRAYLALDLEGKNASIVIYADVDRVKMQSYLEAEMGNEFETILMGNTKVFRSTKPDHSGNAGYFSVVNDEMILAASSEDNMSSMLDRIENGGQALASNSALMDMINRVQYPNGAWAVISKIEMDENFSDKMGHSDEHPYDQNELKMLEAFNTVGMIDNVIFSADLSDNSGVDFVMDAGVSSGYEASDVSSIIKGAVSGAKAASSKSDESMDMLDNIRVSSSNGRVLIRGELPQTMTDKI